LFSSGVLLALSAAFLATGKDLFSKKLAFSMSGIASAFGSFLFALPFYLVALIVAYLLGWESFEVSKTFFIYVILRAVTDAAAEWLKMTALREADISFIAPFLGMAPLFLLVVAPLLIGDIISIYGIFAVLLTVAGSFMLLTGKRQTGSTRAVLIALASAFFFSLNTSFDKLAVQEASPLLSAAAMTLAAGGLLGLPALRSRAISTNPLFSGNYLPLMIRGFLELLFMVTKLTALLYLPAQYVAALGKVSLLLAVFGGGLFFKEGQIFRRVAGCLVILAGVVWVVFLSPDFS